MKTLDTKICKVCGKEKPLSDYYSQVMKLKSGKEYTRYNLACKDCVNKRSKKWQEDNFEQFNAVKNQYNQTDRGKFVLRKVSDKQRLKGNPKRWQKNHPDKLIEYAEKRKTKDHKITKLEWESCKQYFDNCCAYCGLPINQHYIKYKGKMQLGDFHKEHVDDNGAGTLDNCVPSCKRCNSSKHTSRLEDWYNPDNALLPEGIYSKERYDKIIKWILEDYKKYLSNR